MGSVDIAIQMEREAVEFYTKCAEKTTNALGRAMFLSIAEDERYHAACAAQVLEGKPFTPPSTSPKQDLKSVFSEKRNEALEKVAASANDLDALKVAMEMEKKAVEFYRKAAAEAATRDEKALFDCLVKDEEQHFTIYQNTSAFLEDTGNWFMWDDHSIVEG